MKTELRLATPDDMMLLFGWANDSTVRENSFSTEKIELDEHKAWFDNALQREDVIIFIMTCDGENVGQIRLNIRHDVAEISYSIDSGFRGRGFGNHIVSLLRYKVEQDYPQIKKLVARVKSNNYASHKVFINNGFTGKDTVYELEL